MIRILIADDSQVFQRVLSSCLDEESGIEIVGIVDNGDEAIEMCRTLRPDLVTMDIFMPGITGLEATRRIMKECPTRIVIISSMINSKNLKYTFEAMQAGAVEVIDKPQDMLTGNYDNVRKQLLKVIRRSMEAQPDKRFNWSQTDNIRPTARSYVEGDSRDTLFDSSLDREWEIRTIREKFVPRIIALGGSTGAPAVVADILTHLPKNFYVPILIAQHIVKGFSKGMADWLNSGVTSEVRTAEDNMLVKPGQVLFAPDDTHLGITSGNRIILKKRAPTDLYVPSVNHLFKSIATSFSTWALGIILSGMGKDGAEGLLELRKAGGVTIAQNEETSIVWGMPKVATEMGAAMTQMNPSEMIQFLTQIDERVKETLH